MSRAEERRLAGLGLGAAWGLPRWLGRGKAEKARSGAWKWSHLGVLSWCHGTRCGHLAECIGRGPQEKQFRVLSETGRAEETGKFPGVEYLPGRGPVGGRVHPYPQDQGNSCPRLRDETGPVSRMA